MLELGIRTLHNFVYIEPVRTYYASSEEEASNLARSDAGRRALYDRRDRTAHEDDTAHRATLDTRGEITGRTSWRAISGQTGRACGLSKGTLALSPLPPLTPIELRAPLIPDDADDGLTNPGDFE